MPINPKMIKLRRDKERPHRERHHEWLWALPFYVNPRGTLIHRVMRAQTHVCLSKLHFSVHYWCGNASCNHQTEGFTDNPPATRLLCEVCEAKARAAGEKTADELVSRHVHIGRIKPHRTCCNDSTN